MKHFYPAGLLTK